MTLPLVPIVPGMAPDNLAAAISQNNELIKNASLFRIVEKTTIPAVSAGSTQTVTITHDLDYVPMVWAFVDNGGLMIPIPDVQVNGSGVVTESLRWFALGDQVTFSHFSSTGTGAYPVSYYLLPRADDI